MSLFLYKKYDRVNQCSTVESLEGEDDLFSSHITHLCVLTKNLGIRASLLISKFFGFN